MRIVIVGAGAIGTWLGVRLASAGHDVAALARGKTLAAIRRFGMRLVSGGQVTSARIEASDRAAVLGVPDLLILATKTTALAGLTSTLADLVQHRTTVLSAMNGIPWWFLHGMPGDLWDSPLSAIDPEGRI